MKWSKYDYEVIPVELQASVDGKYRQLPRVELEARRRVVAVRRPAPTPPIGPSPALSPLETVLSRCGGTDLFYFIRANAVLYELRNATSRKR